MGCLLAVAALAVFLDEQQLPRGQLTLVTVSCSLLARPTPQMHHTRLREPGELCCALSHEILSDAEDWPWRCRRLSLGSRSACGIRG